ncbi:cbs domain containing protein [Haladaptatus sp. W1]|uniref:CBS domain-containing protein n=1 Tax=unclassified Haladaptatus TaxID=2622732 RepID=UPI0008499E13|nr:MULTISPECIES: CBS domain-containing protein [unclassified Haladaptatus]ODR82261.1 cbs domain containing protein [Haladaptatus sp. W1]
MPVSDIASMEVITAKEETDLVDIASMMSEENVGCVPIVDGRRPVGIVTDRKIALSLADEADASGRTVGDVMTRDPITIDADASVHDAIERMEDADIRRIPVVEDEELVGIVTLDDVLVMLADEMDDAADVIEEQTPRF